MRTGSDRGPMPAPLRGRALRRLVLARTTSVLELGLRRLVRATACGRRISTLLAALVLIVAGAATALHGDEARLRVVATLPDLFVLTRVVAGEAAAGAPLAPPRPQPPPT